MALGDIPGRPALAVITLRQRGDGVAYAGLLLEKALDAIMGPPLGILQLSPVSDGVPSVLARARFALSLFISQLFVRRGWWVFNHVGIARAQRLIPPFVRRPYAVLMCGIEVWDPNLTEKRRIALRHARARIAISRHTAQRVAAQHPEIGPIVACPLALLPSAAMAVTFDRSLLDQVHESSVLVVGRMSAAERYKGHEFTFEHYCKRLRPILADAFS